MRKLLLSLAMLGAIAIVPVRAAPVMQPALAAITNFDQAAVQTVQYGYDRREYRRRLEFRRREQLRREEFRRHHAARHGYYRP